MKLATAILISAVLFCTPGTADSSLGAQASQQRQSAFSRFRAIEPNVHAPELYADKLTPLFCLVNLPGADSPASFIDVSYQVYFVAEAAFKETVTRVSKGGGRLTSPTQFTDKLLLGDGRFRINRLGTLIERTRAARPIDFKAKVPDNLRTKFATVLTAFAVKIYDGKLKTPFYRSSFFATQPFDDDPAQSGRAVPRQNLYTNFFITDKGDLYTSQWRRSPGDIGWHP
ncbi:MAG TPA: hypothetical protein VFV34_08510 [Blastocatellia bacterium]|nr:hypothetical protein [Blastocatellia bacterium]